MTRGGGRGEEEKVANYIPLFRETLKEGNVGQL